MSRRNDKSENSRPPAVGARAAETGIAAQYRFAAKVVLERLLDGILERIFLRDVTAGQVDDFGILTTSGVLHAYQVKWEVDASLFTLSDLLSQKDGSPPLIQALSAGWTNRQRAFPQTRCQVHLVTPSLPSKHSKCGKTPLPPADRHFAAFIREAWMPVHEGRVGRTEDCRGWGETWTDLHKATGLSAEDFLRFVHACNLDFGASLRPSPQASSRREEQLERDIRQLGERFLSLAQEAPRRVQFSRSELLDLLGWPDNARTRNAHEWHPNETWHAPLRATAHALSGAIAAHDSGYVALIGPPGSGKSTALTDCLRGRPDTVRYYAFLRDDPSPAVVRGEAANFLHDLCVLIERKGAVGRENVRSGSDLGQLRERFHRQLGDLHEHWKNTGRKTVLLIDGLDHVPPDRRVVSSMLHELPAPEAVPIGVIFLLGTQTLEVLPTEIAGQFIREPARRQLVTPIPPDDIARALRLAGVGDLIGPMILPQAVRCTAGSPLLLAYLIRAIRQCSLGDDIQELISGLEESGGDVGYYYGKLWGACEGAGSSVTSLLALLSRLRHGFELKAVAVWFAPEELRLFRKTCGQLFKNDDGFWTFFHNSFRRFVHLQSASFDGTFEESVDARFHGRLAEFCAQAPADSPLRSEELYHLAMSGDDTAVLRVASPGHFRRQVLALRPIADLHEDHTLVAQSLRRQPDSLSFCGLGLAAHERDMRLNALQIDHEVFLKLLYFTAPPAIARRHLFWGGRMNLGHEGALAFLHELLRDGRHLEAAELFEVLGVSDGALFGMKLDAVREAVDNMAGWCLLAVKFWPVERVISAVKGNDFLAHETERHADLVPARKWTQERAVAACLSRVAEVLATEGAIASSREIASAVDWEQVAEGRNEVWQLCSAEGWLLRGDRDEARRILVELRAFAFRQVDTQLQRIEICVRCGETEEAARLLSELPHPMRRLLTSNLWNGVETQRVIRLYAARLAVGREPNAPMAIGESIQFRLACLAPVAWFAAQAWLDLHPTREQLCKRLRAVFDEMRKPADEHWRWDTAFDLAHACHEIAGTLVEVCGALGVEAMEELTAAFNAEWSRPIVARQYSLATRQDMITRCLQLGASRSWAEEWLTRWDAEPLGPANSESRVALALSHGASWRAAGRSDHAREWAARAIRVSFGFGYNDGWRLERWVILLAPAWRRDPDWGLPAMARVARCLPGLEYEFNSHGGAGSAAEHLVGVAFQISPRAGRALLEFFRAQKFRSPADCALEIVRSCSDLPHAPFDILGGLVAEHIYVEENAADEKHLLAWLRGAISARGWSEAAALALKLPSPRAWRPRGFLAEPWWRGLVLAALQSNCDPRELGLSDKDVAACRADWAEGHSVTNSAVAVAVLDAADPVSKLRELRDIARASRRSSHSAPIVSWAEVLELALPRLDVLQLTQIADLLQDEHHFQYIAAAMAPRLIVLGARSEAWALGERALDCLKARGRLDSANKSERLAALRPMLLADAARAREQVFATAAQHGLPDPDDLQPLLPLLLTQAEQDTFAREAQAFLETALDGCDTGVPPLHLPASVNDATTLRAVFLI